MPLGRIGSQLPPAAPDDPDAGAPEWYRRTRTLRRIPLIAAVVITVIILRASQGSPPPTLATSCTTPAFALSTYETQSPQTVRWSATGPKGMHFALAIGVDHFTRAPDGHLAPVPDPGVAANGTRTSAPQTMGDDCTDDGTFGVVLPVGTYTVRLFEINGESAAQVVSVAERKLTITP